MRILMVSMNSIHFQRWTNQLKDSGHEVFWFDIKDGAKVPDLSWVKSYQDWRLKVPNFKGRHKIKKYLPSLYKLLENDTAKAFENVLLEVQPDVVHSFVLYMSCVPILGVMQKYQDIKWIYSAWGNDLFYYQNIPEYKRGIVKVLPRIDYLFTDCKRDVALAKKMGFNGTVLGTFPGGGGYDFSVSDCFIKTPVLSRKVILIKGYQGRLGRGIKIIKAIEEIKLELKNYQIVVFGADDEMEDYIEKNNKLKKNNLKVYSKSDFLPHKAVLELMGKSLIYIGNSISDGMPNTLLEAVIEGAFPIQSNPGGASAEIITHKKNGLLIEDCLSVNEIRSHIIYALNHLELIEEAFHFNQEKIKPQLEIKYIKQKVLTAYKIIEKDK